VGGLGCVGQNEMCYKLCRLLFGFAALLILRSVGILSVYFTDIFSLLYRLLA